MDLMSDKTSTDWIIMDSLRCPHCGAAWTEASEFRTTRRSELIVYCCRRCRGIYNLYSGMIFEACHLCLAQVVTLDMIID